MLTGCSLGSPDDGPIVIGGIVVLSGPDASYGEEDQRTADLRIKQINDAGGINGRELQVLWRDGQCKTDVAKEAATKLIKEEGVNIILGGTCSASTLGIAEVANREKVLQIAHGGSSAEIAKAGPFTFRTISSTSDEWKILNNYLLKNRIKSIGVIHEDRAYTNAIQEKLKEVFQGEMWEESFLEGEVDFYKSIKNIQEKEVEVLFINTYNNEILYVILDQLVEQKYQGVLMVNTQGFRFLRENRDNEQLKSFEEIIVADFFLGKEKPKLNKFIAEYEEHYGEPPKYSIYIEMMLDAVDVLSEVLSVVEDVSDADAVREGMAIVQHVGISRPIIFDKNGDMRIDYKLYRFDGENFIQFEL